MTCFQPTNSDTAWQREKTTIIQAITKVAPCTVLLDVLCVPLEVVGGAVSRTVVVCTETRIDNATRAAIRTRIAALNPCEDRFDVVYRTGEINRIYAEVIGARREWIAAVFDEEPAQTRDAALVEGDEVEAKETLAMVDGLVKAEVARALQEIEAEAAVEQIEAEVKAEKSSPAARGDATQDQVTLNISRPRAAKPAARPSGLQAPKTISTVPSRLQAPSRSLSMCPKQSPSVTPKVQQRQQQQQQQPKTLPRAQSTSRLQAPQKTPLLSAPLRAPVKSKLVQPRAKTEPAGKSVMPRPAGKTLAPPLVQGLPRPASCVASGVGGPSTRIGMLPRALPRPTRG
ncbi:hypothetical protein MCOR02_012252 [Pyricularia oryzae]|uniref:Uncharacterized protein n=1 Tax=Pyricularia oryzae TaxID=318829 RepID=A0A4V1C722_PYROR|nr:hypothetical protein MCOR02_012252 [Pyricularia oryzae]KAI6327877.1 hypothetical protein MCOR34_000378 [Pyricularia oryzae]KAI6474872.1 hypothetical protein MCOR17_001900 [Pyricularia oryzae]KAI6507601.1 hypothetical protein MCOR13_002692 [Pyricularia oryzae]KAI6606085.1 hypothetical protein MCOR04_001005 [Pyricularia oryzae]